MSTGNDEAQEMACLSAALRLLNRPRVYEVQPADAGISIKVRLEADRSPYASMLTWVVQIYGRPVALSEEADNVEDLEQRASTHLRAIWSRSQLAGCDVPQFKLPARERELLGRLLDLGAQLIAAERYSSVFEQIRRIDGV